MATAKRSARKSTAKTPDRPDAPASSAPSAGADPESLPVGVVIEKEAAQRWKVHVPNQNTSGHGTTHGAAVADYLRPR